MTKHAELIERLEAAEVGSRELDALIWDIEDDRPRWSLGGVFPIYKRDPEDGVAFDSPPSYTTSLDAALALADRVLPESRGVICFGGRWSSAQLHCEDVPKGTAKTPALALCIAILKALEAKQ